MVFISSELDLDRDVPDGEIEVEWNEDGSIKDPINVDWASGISWVKEEDWMTPLVDVTMDNEVQKVEAMYGC